MAARPTFYRSHSTIQEFDGDSSEGLSEGDVDDLGEGGAASRQVVSTTQHVHTNLLLVALLDHLSTLYVEDETKRYQLYKALVNALVAANILRGFGSLDEASSLRAQYKLAFSKLLNTAIATVQPKEFPTSNLQQRASLFLHPRLNARQPLVVPSLSTILTHNSSRYHEEFLQIRRVGYGAYGSVWKVRNKLDNCEYAIKKISFEGSEPDLWLKIINEVKLLAQLSHKHVVRYHNAWIEYETPALFACTHKQVSVPRLPPAEVVPALTYEKPTDDQPSLRLEKEDKADYIDQDDSIIFAEVSSAGISARQLTDSPSSTSLSGSISSLSLNGAISSPSSDSIGQLNGRVERERAVVILHIQMELCTHTLKDWIHSRNERLRDTDTDKYRVVDAAANQVLLRQILKAVCFIHDHKLMHRDIKPKNIFLTQCESGTGCDIAKVGDFGLARQASGTGEPLTPHPGQPHKSQSSCKVDAYTCGVGTTIYAAPEQLSGSNYTQKCDMYSLGLVIFEMYQPFRTEMERIDSLNDLRKHMLPEEFLHQWPEQARYIGELLAEDAELRPSAAEMLQSELFNSRVNVISTLRSQNSTLLQENAELRKLLAKRDSEIAMLRRELVNMASPRKKDI